MQIKKERLYSWQPPRNCYGRHNNNKEPETVTFYNKTICSIDIADQMARQYTVKIGTRSWPVAFFYYIVNLANINAYVLHKKKTGNAISRKNFMFKLATELREAHVKGKTALL